MNILLKNIAFFAHNTPNNIALRGSSTRSLETVQLTYSQLWQEIKLTEQKLISNDCQCIALRAENSIDWAIIDLAALLANITVIPIPMFFSEQQVDHILNSANIDTLIGDWPHIAGEKAINFSYLNGYKVTKQGSFAPLFAETNKITFTSGSTGSPKGVCLSQSHLQKVTQSLISTINNDDKPLSHLVLLPLSTLLENITGIYVPLQMGVCSVIYSGEKVGLQGSSKFDVTVFCQILQREKPHSLVLTPALLQVLIQIAMQQPQLISTLKFVAVGGAHVSEAIMQKALALGIPAYEGYGLSECGSVVSLNSHAHNKLGSCGQPLAHCNVSVAADGEIIVSEATMLGYLGEQATKNSIHTGDIGYLDKDNYLHITGRKSNLLITSYGRNISPEWIESEAHNHSELQQIVIIGDAQESLTAIVAAQHSEQQSTIAAIKKLNNSLPDYAQIATLVMSAPFTQYPQLLTANGRPMRNNFSNLFTPMIDHSIARPNSVKLISIKEKAMQNNMQPTSDFFTQLQEATAIEQQKMYQQPIFAACQRGEISLQSYYAFLTQAYHHVKHTVPLLMACGSRLSENYEWLRSALAQYIEEEKGHHEWILNDINACGFDAKLVRNNQGTGKVGSGIELMVAYLYHQIDRKNPLAFLGMVWVLEGTSVNVGGKIAELVQQKLNLPDAAMSYLTSHSTLDQEHIKLFASLVNKISDKADQQAIIDGANMVFKLYSQMLAALPTSSETITVVEVCHEA
ncbi:AMP-binding protein [Psychromonas sp. MME2]|uniref:AMP-binding protein n=1 Tax=unclassified Psychromonas TaxID=2614957 RepID=UPI00339D29E9